MSSIPGIYTVFEKGDRVVVYNQSLLEGDLLVPVTKARESRVQLASGIPRNREKSRR